MGAAPRPQACELREPTSAACRTPSRRPVCRGERPTARLLSCRWFARTHTRRPMPTAPAPCNSQQGPHPPVVACTSDASASTISRRPWTQSSCERNVRGSGAGAGPCRREGARDGRIVHLPRACAPIGGRNARSPQFPDRPVRLRRHGELNELRRRTSSSPSKTRAIGTIQAS